MYTTMSIDGGISYPGRKIVLSSDRDLKRLHYYRSIVDGVMVGANTVISDNPLLTVRLPNYTGKQPWRIVVDSKLRTPSSAKVYDTSIAPSILITSNENKYSSRIREYMEKGVEIVFVDKIEDEILDLRKAFTLIEEKYGIHSILVEGGGYLIGTLLRLKLIDEIHLSIAPVILGKNKVPLVNIELEEPIKLELPDALIDNLTGEIILTYKPLY